MSERAPRLGDVVDDYCPRCRLLLNHDVAALLEARVAKVTCRTCFNTHDYRHAQEPARRKPAARRPDKQTLMDQVLAGLGRPPGAPPRRPARAGPGRRAGAARPAPPRPPRPRPRPRARAGRPGHRRRPAAQAARPVGRARAHPRTEEELNARRRRHPEEA